MAASDKLKDAAPAASAEGDKATTHDEKKDKPLVDLADPASNKALTQCDAEHPFGAMTGKITEIKLPGLMLVDPARSRENVVGAGDTTTTDTSATTAAKIPDLLAARPVVNLGDGSLLRADAGGIMTGRLPQEITPSLDNRPAFSPFSHQQEERLKADAAAIRTASGDDNWIFRGADRERINTLLETKNERERAFIDDHYKATYGMTLREWGQKYMHGDDLNRFNNAMDRKDNDSVKQNADELHAHLGRLQNISSDRSRRNLEQEVREIFRTSNSEQIAQMDQHYREKYGMSLEDGLTAGRVKLSQTTMDAIQIYKSGIDQRSPEDLMRLTELAFSSKDKNLFQQAMRDMTPEQRRNFLDEDGAERVRQTFDFKGGEVGLQTLLDFTRGAKLEAPTKIRMHTGYVDDNEQGIELALTSMSAQNRSDYQIGRAMRDSSTVLSSADRDRLNGLTVFQKQEAREYYDVTSKALKDAGNDTEIARWEAIIAGTRPNFVANLDRHRGVIYNSSTDDIKHDIEHMSRSDWEDMKAHPEYRPLLREMLVSLN